MHHRLYITPVDIIKMIKLLVLSSAFLVGSLASHQNYPGTSTRPIFSSSEAYWYTKETYLQGWTPSKIGMSHVDYTVGSGGYSTIQAAINDAIKAGGTTRKYIHVLPGTYNQIVIIPQTTVPLTIYGTYKDPSQVVIRQSQGANLSGSNYAKLNGALFRNGDPAYSIFENCASRATIGTFCSSVFYAKAENVEVAYITIDNPSIDGQAVAVRAGGDMQHYDHVYMYGFQDTVYAEGKRLYINKAQIKGDVDFIFGGAAAVFESCHILARADRPRNSAVVFAPNTASTNKYGFLVINSKITADNGIKADKGCHLARGWDTNGANGQVVIRDTEIADVINVNAPYDTAAGGRPYKGNTNTNRNLDDPNYNRFWEYNNSGGGA